MPYVDLVESLPSSCVPLHRWTERELLLHFSIFTHTSHFELDSSISLETLRAHPVLGQWLPRGIQPDRGRKRGPIRVRLRTTAIEWCFGLSLSSWYIYIFRRQSTRDAEGQEAKDHDWQHTTRGRE